MVFRILKPRILLTLADNSTTFEVTANFVAFPETPFVNVEDFVPFVDDITCSANEIDITFTTEQAFNNAQTWPSAFKLITSMPEYCGTPDNGRTFYKCVPVKYYDLSDVVQCHFMGSPA